MYLHETVGRQVFSHLEPYQAKHMEEIASIFEKEGIVNLFLS